MILFEAFWSLQRSYLFLLEATIFEAPRRNNSSFKKLDLRIYKCFWKEIRNLVQRGNGKRDHFSETLRHEDDDDEADDEADGPDEA